MLTARPEVSTESSRRPHSKPDSGRRGSLQPGSSRKDLHHGKAADHPAWRMRSLPPTAAAIVMRVIWKRTGCGRR